MKNLQFNYQEFLKIFLEQTYHSLVRRSDHDSYVVHSVDAHIIIYKDFLSTIPLDAFMFPVPILNSYGMVVFDYEVINTLDQENFNILKASIVEAMEYYFKIVIGSTLVLESNTVEVIPFEHQYFHDSDKILYCQYKVETTSGMNSFFLIFSVKDFENGFCRPISLAS